MHTCFAKLTQKLLRAAGHVSVSNAAQNGSVTGVFWGLKSVTCITGQRMINVVMVKGLFLPIISTIERPWSCIWLTIPRVLWETLEKKGLIFGAIQQITGVRGISDWAWSLNEVGYCSWKGACTVTIDVCPLNCCGMPSAVAEHLLVVSFFSHVQLFFQQQSHLPLVQCLPKQQEKFSLALKPRQEGFELCFSLRHKHCYDWYKILLQWQCWSNWCAADVSWASLNPDSWCWSHTIRHGPIILHGLYCFV